MSKSIEISDSAMKYLDSRVFYTDPHLSTIRFKNSGVCNTNRSSCRIPTNLSHLTDPNRVKNTPIGTFMMPTKKISSVETHRRRLRNLFPFPSSACQPWTPPLSIKFGHVGKSSFEETIVKSGVKVCTFRRYVDRDEPRQRAAKTLRCKETIWEAPSPSSDWARRAL